MRMTVRQRAGEHTVFAPGAFDSQLGKRVPFKLEERQVGTAVLVAAEIVEDGTAVLLTWDVDTPETSSLSP